MSMRDKSVSLDCVVSWALWFASVAFVTAGMAAGMAGASVKTMGGLIAFGLLASAGAATATLRTHIARQSDQLRIAYELGRHSVSELRQVR